MEAIGISKGRFLMPRVQRVLNSGGGVKETLSAPLQARYKTITGDFSKWNTAILSVLKEEAEVKNRRERRSWWDSLADVRERGKQIIKTLGNYDQTLENALRSSSQFSDIQSTMKKLGHYNPFDPTDVGFTAELGPSKNGKKLQLRIFYDPSPDPDRYHYGG